MRDERQRAWFGSGLVEDLFDEAGLEPKSRAERRPFDRAPELGRLHRPDQHLIAADAFGQPGVRSRRGVEVGADGEHHANRPFAIGVEGREDVEERLTVGFARGIGVGQQLFELVDREQHVRAGRDEPAGRARIRAQGFGRNRREPRIEPAELVRELVECLGAGAEQEHLPVLAAGQRARGQRRNEAGSEERRLTTA